MPRLIQMSLANRPMTNLEMASRARKANLAALHLAWEGKAGHPDRAVRRMLIKEMLKAAALRVETQLAMDWEFHNRGTESKRSLTRGTVTIQEIPDSPVGLSRVVTVTMVTPAKVPTLTASTETRQEKVVRLPRGKGRFQPPTRLWWTPDSKSMLARQVLATQMHELLDREQKIMEMWAETGTPPPKHLLLQPKPTSKPSDS